MEKNECGIEIPWSKLNYHSGELNQFLWHVFAEDKTECALQFKNVIQIFKVLDLVGKVCKLFFSCGVGDQSGKCGLEYD